MFCKSSLTVPDSKLPKTGRFLRERVREFVCDSKVVWPRTGGKARIHMQECGDPLMFQWLEDIM